jgi:hypothetical protein
MRAARLLLERGSLVAAPLQRETGLNRRGFSAARRQAIFLGATEPRPLPDQKSPPRCLPWLVGQGRMTLSTVRQKSYIDTNLRPANTPDMTIVA